MINYTEGKQILTSRKILRMVRPEDLDFVHELHSLDETDQFNTLGIPSDEHETKILLNQWIEAFQVTPVSGYTFIILHHQSKNH